MKKLIIFDFDGVIADSYDYCFGMNKSIYNNITPEEYKSWFFGNFYTGHNKREGKEEAKKIQKLYWKEFEKDHHTVKLFPKIDSILKKLSIYFKLVIVSSCKDELINGTLERENISSYFQKIYGISYHESRVEKFRHVLKDFDVDENDCLFITDTLGDLIEAEKVGITSIAVTWGFHDEGTLGKGKYKTMVHEPGELLEVINSHFNENN